MRYHKLVVASTVFSLIILLTCTVFAGPYSNELAKCLVRSTSEGDKNDLVKWMFAAFASHPEVKSMASISETQREELNEKTANLMMRLLTESCRFETAEALKYEGQGTLEAGFQVLGSVAARGLMSHPDVANYIAGLDRYIDPQKLKSVIGSAP